ncbi:MAG: hypothetical protein KAS93_07305 [Gammaproteobacteria bacterium]|nr:hypothetical protein [Gammaproteobacteria bacterium]
MNTKKRIITGIVLATALAIAGVHTNVVAGVKLPAQVKKAITLQLDFDGGSKNVTIHPLAKRSDMYLIKIHNTHKIMAKVAGAPAGFKIIPMQTLATKLWHKQILKAAFVGKINKSNKETEIFVFKLFNPSYDKKTKTLTVYALAYGSHRPTFYNQQPVMMTAVDYLIDPLPLVISNNWNGY